MPSPDRTPWQDDKVWSEMELSLSTAIRESHVLDDDYLCRIVRDISLEFNKVEDLMNVLCNTACYSCRDVCCRHATVWYDFRDLLYFTLRYKNTPERQMSKSPDGLCICLGKQGCTLSRPERPFICTWYLCSAQKEILTDMGGERLKKLVHSLDKMKELRKELEMVFCQICLGRITKGV